MARQRLADLVREEPAEKTGSDAAPSGREVGSLPKYLTLVRKECRLREDQAEALTRLSRRLNRHRQVRAGDRITENTLIRVAVDALLAQEERLAGDSEAELRKSVGNKHTDSVVSESAPPRCP